MKWSSSIYLGASAKYYAGVELTEYDKYLMYMRENIPVINKYGYMDSEGEWYMFDEEATDDTIIQDILRDYNIIEYANVFDTEKYGDLLR